MTPHPMGRSGLVALRWRPDDGLDVAGLRLTGDGRLWPRPRRGVLAAALGVRRRRRARCVRGVALRGGTAARREGAQSLPMAPRRGVHRAAPRPRAAPIHAPARTARQVHGHTVPRCALPFLSGAASNASVFVLSHFHASQASHPANLTPRVRDRARPRCQPNTAPRARASVRTHHVERPRRYRARRRAQRRRTFHLRVDAVGRPRAPPRHVAAGRPSRQQELALSACCVRGESTGFLHSRSARRCPRRLSTCTTASGRTRCGPSRQCGRDPVRASTPCGGPGRAMGDRRSTSSR